MYYLCSGGEQNNKSLVMCGRNYDHEGEPDQLDAFRFGGGRKPHFTHVDFAL